MFNKNQWLILVLVMLSAALIGGSIGYQKGLSSSQAMTSLSAPAVASVSSAKTLAFYRAMDRLWSDHVIWTREYIVRAVAGTPDVSEAATRLLKNQDDIGAAVGSIYGKAAGDQLTTLLKEHIMIAVDLIDAAKTNNKAKFSDANTRWKANADAIADFLAGANPAWSKDDLRAMMQKHLETTTAEVVARLEKNYVADTQAFDAVYTHMLMMSTALADGIIAQHPEQFQGE